MKIDIPNAIFDPRIAIESADAIECLIGYATLKSLPGMIRLTITGVNADQWVDEYHRRFSEILKKSEQESVPNNR